MEKQAAYELGYKLAFLGALGRGARNVWGHDLGRNALLGAGIGGAAGAATADPGNRMSGFARGALAGGTMGTGMGVGRRVVNNYNVGLRGVNDLVAPSARRFLPSTATAPQGFTHSLGNALNYAPGGAPLAALGTAGVGGALAGSTAQEKNPFKRMMM